MAEGGRVFSGFVDKVEFAGKIPTLVKATADEESPTPGYLYKEICAISLESGSACQCLLDYLVDRLQHRSYHVRLKVLLVMKELCTHGDSEFRNGLRKSAEGIRQCTSYSGPPDVLHGNAPYLKIRVAARALQELLFGLDTDRSTDSQIPSISVYGMGPMEGTMQGFGNTPVTSSKSFGESIISGMRDFAEKMIEPSSNKTFEVQQSAANMGLYSPAHVVMTAGSGVKNVANIPSTRRPRKDRIAGRALGGWGSDDDEADHPQNSRSSGSDPDAVCDRLETVSTCDWSAEFQLVDNWTTAVAEEALPKRQDIASFVKRGSSCLKFCAGDFDCRAVDAIGHLASHMFVYMAEVSSSSMNCDKILELLNAKLENTKEDVVVMKILLVIEAYLRSDFINTEQILQVFSASLVEVHKSFTDAPQAKARKIIRILEKLSAKNETILGTDSAQGQGQAGVVMDTIHTTNSQTNNTLVDLTMMVK